MLFNFKDHPTGRVAVCVGFAIGVLSAGVAAATVPPMPTWVPTWDGHNPISHSDETVPPGVSSLSAAVSGVAQNMPITEVENTVTGDPLVAEWPVRLGKQDERYSRPAGALPPGRGRQATASNGTARHRPLSGQLAGQIRRFVPEGPLIRP